MEDPFPQFSSAPLPEFDPEPWSPPPWEPAHHTFAADDGIRLHYLEWPSDPGATTVLMIHGRRGHAHWFDPVVKDLAPRYRCLSMDLRGHGDSGNDGDAGSFRRYAADVAQMMQRVRDGRLILFPHSMAGRLAIMAHQHHGQTPDLLVMADTPIQRRPHHMRPEPRYKAKAYPSLEAAVSRFRLIPPGTSAHPDLIDYIAAHGLRQAEDGSWTWKFDEAGSSRPFGSDFPSAEDLDLESYPCPTLVICGDRSELVSEEDARLMAERFPKGELAAIPGTYHHLMFDRPSEFNRAVLEFFERHGF